MLDTLADNLLDKLLSIEGAMAAAGAGCVLYTTTALTKFLSGGEKDWLTGMDVWRGGLAGDPRKGIILGRYRGFLICDTSDNGIGEAGTTGTGKTACAFLASLLMNTLHSFLVYDQSGDLWKKTSGIRSKIGPTYRVDPSWKNSACINILDMLPNDEHLISNLNAIYKPFFDGSGPDRKKTGGDPHWAKDGLKLFVHITKHVLLGDDPSIKNIAGVLSFTLNTNACLMDMIENARDPVCRDIAVSAATKGERYVGSVISAIDTAMSIFLDPSVARITSSSSFHIEEMVTSASGPMTVYLTAPTTKLPYMMPLYVGIEQVMRLHLMDNTETTLSGKKRCRPFIIADDEAQNTKRPDIDFLEVIRKFGGRAFFGFQGYKAMETLYPGKLELLKTLVSFRPMTGRDDSKTVSSISGTYKKKVVTYSEGQGGKRGRSGKTWRIEEKPRLSAGDLEDMPVYGRALLTIFGYKPAMIQTFDSEQEPEFKKLILPPFDFPASRKLQSPWSKVAMPILPPDPRYIRNRQDAEEVGALDEQSSLPYNPGAVVVTF